MLGKSKVLNNDNNWYDEIDPISFYEKHFEETFLKNISEVYPDFIGVPFALTIRTSDEETSAPDLAMIKSDYSEWFVIEVEMGRHSWDNHVEKQVRVFANGIYEKNRIAKYIKEKNSSLDEDLLKKMIDNHTPKVMVIVNEDKPDWKKKAKKYKAIISTFQIYKGVDGLELYRIEGDSPYVYRDKSHAAFVKGISNMMQIFTPTFITEDSGTDINVIFRGKKTIWKVLREEDKVYFALHGTTNFFQLEKKYIVYTSESGEYYLEIN